MKKQLIFLIIIILLGLSVRLIGLNKESYWLDETISIRQAQAPYMTTLYYLENDVHMPLYISSLWIWVHLFGTSEFVTRLLSCIFGTLSIYIIYLIGKELFNKDVALYAAALLAISPIAVYYSSETRLYSLLMLLAALSIYSFILAVKKNEIKYFYFLGAINILFLYTHIFSLFIMGAEALWLLIYRWPKKNIIFRWMVVQAIVIISFLPWLKIFFVQYSHISIAGQNWLTKPGILTILGTLVTFSGSIYLLIVSVAVFISGLIIFKHTKKDWVNVNMILLWAFLPMIMLYIISLLITPVYNDRYLLYSLLAFIMALSWSIDKFKLKLKILFAAVIVVLCCISLVHQYYEIDKDDWRAVSSYLKNNVQPQDYIIIYPYYEQDPLTYYYNSQCIKEKFTDECNFDTKHIITINIGSKCCSANSDVVNQTKLGDYTNKTIYLVILRPEIYEQNNSLVSYLNQSMILVDEKSFIGGFSSNIMVYKFQ